MAYYTAIYLTGTEPSKAWDWSECSSQGIKVRHGKSYPSDTLGLTAPWGSHFSSTQARKYPEEILSDALVRQHMTAALMFLISSYFHTVPVISDPLISSDLSSTKKGILPLLCSFSLQLQPRGEDQLPSCSFTPRVPQEIRGCSWSCPG